MTQDARVTLTEVARAAGVSLATASKVMNGREDVREQTRRDVAAIARDMGYVPRRRTPSPRRRIVLVFNSLTSPYELQVLEGADDAAQRADVDMVVVKVRRESGSRRAVPETLSRAWMADLSARGVAGVVAVTTPIGPEHVRWSREANLPLIVVDPVVPQAEVRGLVTIAATNWDGGMEAVQHLVDLGHRRIGVLAGPPDSIPARQRLLGYRSVLEQCGIPFDPELVVGGAFSYDEGHRGARHLLSLPERPTALFAVADALGVGALRAAREAELEVPADLSVISFDDSMIAQWTYPQLTAVHQPLFAMGQVAVERLLALSADPAQFAHPFQLETHLVRRESTAPAGASVS